MRALTLSLLFTVACTGDLVGGSSADPAADRFADAGGVAPDTPDSATKNPNLAPTPDAAVTDIEIAEDLAAAEDLAVAEDAGNIAVDQGAPKDPPLLLSVVFRQKVQACSSCGIWFHWQGVQSQKPRLEVVYEHANQQHVRQYQHGLGGEDNAHAISLRSDATEGDRDDRRHTMLIKKAPSRTGLVRVVLSDIPASATIISAKLHLHLHNQEGLANSDHSSEIAIYECPGDWSWDTVTWTERVPGIPWKTPGGDVGRMVRLIHADTDMHQRGFTKASPNGFFDITAHVQLLQSER